MGEAHGSEWQKMVAGELYNAQDPELIALRAHARRILRNYNASAESGSERADLLAELFGVRAEGLWIEPPFYCDYEKNIRLGRNVYFNFDCVVLDVAPVSIGDYVKFGPAVQIYTATHPLDAADHRSGVEFARPVQVELDVWVGGATVINPGVKIGAGSIIGAGSVVIRDVPNGVFAAGNPCRVVREIRPGERTERPYGG